MATTSSGADPAMVDKIANHLKSQGIFDQFRRDCLEDVDTKPAYQNLRQKVESYVSTFLSKVKWEPKMNKNQLRDSLRRQINQSEMLSTGVERIIEQVIEPKMQHVFRPQIEKVVEEFMGPGKDKDVENVKKDLTSTSGWQGGSHLTSAPIPPDLPPGVPTPAPPLPPSEPPAAPPEAPPEAPPDEPPEAPPDSLPEEPEVPSKGFHLGTSPKVSPATDGSITPTLPSGGNTPSSTSSKGRETPNILKKYPGNPPPLLTDIKGDKKLDSSSESAYKMTSQTTKGQAGKNVSVKDQNVKKQQGKDGQQKSQLTKMVKKVEPCSKEKAKQLAAGGKITDSFKTADKAKVLNPDKPKVSIPGKAAVQKIKPVADIKDKLLVKDLDVTHFQGAVKKTSQDSQNITQLSEPESNNKGSSSQLLDSKAVSDGKSVKETENFKPVAMSIQDFLEKSQKGLPVVSSNMNPTSVEPKDETAVDMDMDIEMAGDENTNMPLGNEESDGESGLSDISVSSVHTSDLSSFDEGISSTSSSSSVDSSSDEETELKLVLKKKKKTTNVCPSDSGSEAPSESPSEVTISTDTSRPASVSSDRASSKRSPKGQTASGRALAISRYHGDSEDEDSRLERRKKAAMAKEERAQRRQLAKEEREKFTRVTRQKRVVDSESLEESSDSKKEKREEVASPTKATKKQLKEQKMLEKKREVRRRRSLNKRYFSDEFSSSLQGLKETVSQLEQEERENQEKSPQPELTPYKAFIPKEKLQCFHLVYRERRESQVKCHHLLNHGLSGEQQRKLSTRKRKERKDSKIAKFSFPLAKAAAGVAGKEKGKPTAGDKQKTVEKQQLDSQQQQEHEQQNQRQPEQQEEEPQQQLKQEQQEQQETQKEQEQEEAQKEQEQQQQDEGHQEKQQQHQPISVKQESSEETIKQHLPSKEKTPAEQLEAAENPLQKCVNPEEVIPSGVKEDQQSMEMRESVAGIGEDVKIEEEVQPSEKYEDEGEEKDPEKARLELEKGEDVEMQEGQEEGKDGVEENVKADEGNNEKTPLQENLEGERVKTNIESSQGKKEDADDTLTIQADDETKPQKDTQIQDDAQKAETNQIVASGEKPNKQAATQQEVIPHTDSIPIQQVIEPALEENVKVPLVENTSDDNPPTPTQDEPAIYSESGSESEEQSDKGSSIPIYTVHSPKHLPLGSIFKLSQTSLQDVKPVGSRVGEVRMLSTDSNASGTDDTKDLVEGSPESENTGSEDYQGATESIQDSHKPDSSETLAEEPSTSDISEPNQPESRYGTRPKRHAVSPRDSLDDDYYYYGQSKRGRYSQSPVSQEEPVKSGRSVTRRMSSDSGKSEGTTRETPDKPTRPSRQRHISPPHRYSPSDTRSSQRRASTSSPHPPTAPNLSAKPSRRGSSPSSHEHFTRRSSTREEVKRGNRYSDMYYYNDRGSRNQPSTRCGDRGRASEAVTSRRSSRRSVDDRTTSQTKRRK